MYNKLFTKILDSSIWLEPVETRIVWITLLAAMDEDGYCHFAAIENLAARARVSIEQAQAAVKCLESPDKNSSNPENRGRRIQRVPGGFLILNAKVHREIQSRVEEREKTRERVARFRAKLKGVTPLQPLHTVTEPLPTVTSVYASASEHGIGGKGERAEEIKQLPDHLNTPRMQNKWQVWQNVRRGFKKPKSWLFLFNEQIEWLSQFTEDEAFESLSASIRNGWVGLQPPKLPFKSQDKPKPKTEFERMADAEDRRWEKLYGPELAALRAEERARK